MTNLIDDIDPIETQEWLDAFTSVLREEGDERARYILQKLIERAGRVGGMPPYVNTAYVNTIQRKKQTPFPGNIELEQKLDAILRWNAIVMVLRAGKKASELGGHLSTYASAATLYEVGFNHFFHAATENHGGDLLYIQGHSSPGIYARSFLEGRFTEDQLNLFRQEVEKPGLSSYPHSWLMPDYWQFATVSMGLGPLQGIYQARFLKYLQNRGIANTEKRKVWVFCGDGEMDEPESLGNITAASRENLDNLIFVINCNLQRLDGPVRGNGKIIQELESVFRGAGWHVIKVIWGEGWDRLLAKDRNGLLRQRMMEAVDGEYQNYKAKDGAYVRENFFGKYPELKEMVSDMSDAEIWSLTRGGHDIQKVYAAYAAAVQHKDQPVVILAKTVKGFGLGNAGEAKNVTHQLKKLSVDDLKVYRDRLKLPISDEKIEKHPFYKPADNSPEIRYLQERRKALGGYLPARRARSSEKLTLPSLDLLAPLLESSGDREVSTTMVFVRILHSLLKEKNIGSRVVPIVPDESRTFGMEGLFRQVGIYSWQGQLYEPVDADQVMSYREDKKGQILQEGLNEPGAVATWIAAATSYSVSDRIMIPFYIYYSMFGYQRVGDFIWAAGDMQARGFLLGATAGRTTLAGEGLQHQDGHNLLMFSFVPNCVAYDPTYSYELAVIIQDGLERMIANQENIFYYITLMNENYQQPAMPKDAREGIIKGMYCLREGKAKSKLKVQLLGSGTILREVIAAADLLQKDFGVDADIWSVTSFSELRKEALDVERQNLLHPKAKAKKSYVEMCLENRVGPVIAATDYIRLNADQIRPFISQPYTVLGTDGYGRSDTRAELRHFFEVNRFYIALAALKALADSDLIPISKVEEAIKLYKINPDKPNPVTV